MSHTLTDSTRNSRGRYRKVMNWRGQKQKDTTQEPCTAGQNSLLLSQDNNTRYNSGSNVRRTTGVGGFGVAFSTPEKVSCPRLLFPVQSSRPLKSTTTNNVLNTRLGSVGTGEGRVCGAVHHIYIRGKEKHTTQHNSTRRDDTGVPKRLLVLRVGVIYYPGQHHLCTLLHTYLYTGAVA